MSDVAVTVRNSVLYEAQQDEQPFTLFFPKKTITARERIGRRVALEVQAYNDHLSEVFQGQVAEQDHQVPAQAAYRCAVAGCPPGQQSPQQVFQPCLPLCTHREQQRSKRRSP